jgi:hypothetical protein
MDYKNITTSKQMNEVVKEQLILRGDHLSKYAAKRIEDLEKQLELTAVVQAKPEKVCAMCNQSKEDDGHNCCEDCGGVSL